MCPPLSHLGCESLFRQVSPGCIWYPSPSLVADQLSRITVRVSE